MSVALPIGSAPRAQTPAQSTLPDAAGELRIRLPGLILAAPASETRFPIEISPTDKVPAKSFVRVRGLPPAAALNAGHVIAPGSWAVPVAALDALLIAIPVGVGGKSDVSVALVTIDGLVLGEARTALVVAAAGLIAPGPSAERSPSPVPLPPPADAPSLPMPRLSPQPRIAAPSVTPPRTSETPTEQPPAEVRPPPKDLDPAARKRAEGFLTRGRTLMQEGNIVQSRLFFERAADDGLAEGALAMGTTYDPAELAKLRVQGITADRDQARRWYDRARQLGSPTAPGRLEALDRR